MTIPDPVEPAPATGSRPHDEGQDAALREHDRLLTEEEIVMARMVARLDDMERRLDALEGASR